YETPEKQLELKTKLVSFTKQTAPICHDQALIKAAEFLINKKKSESPLEQKVYQSLNLAEFVFRLYHNRPLVCFEKDDKTKFFGIPKYYDIHSPYLQHLKIGTPEEEYPFVLQDIISYPEREISEYFVLLSPTFFINN